MGPQLQLERELPAGAPENHVGRSRHTKYLPDLRRARIQHRWIAAWNTGGCYEFDAPRAFLQRRGEPGWLDYQQIAWQRVQQVFGCVAEKEAAHAGARNRAHDDDCAMSLAGGLLYGCDRMAGQQMAPGLRYPGRAHRSLKIQIRGSLCLRVEFVALRIAQQPPRNGLFG